METKKNKIDQWKESSPFRVPEGYFEGLTEQIMNQLPEQQSTGQNVPPVTWIDRIRPIFYLAAVFIGLGFFFKIIAPKQEEDISSQSLLVKLSSNNTEQITDSTYDENQDYLEYIEEQFFDNALYERLEIK